MKTAMARMLVCLISGNRGDMRILDFSIHKREEK